MPPLAGRARRTQKGYGIRYHPLVRVYLDLCCLKRPLDRQEHPVVRLETEAILALLGAPADRVILLRSAVHALESSKEVLGGTVDYQSQ